MKVVIAGGTGFIGEKLTDFLLRNGHDVIILSRREKEATDGARYVKWLGHDDRPEKEIEGADVFINLAGVSINNGRWSASHQKQIYESRMTATDELLRILSNLSQKPSTFINASAIGIYPASLQTVYTEESNAKASDFLGKTVHDWEQKAKRAESYGIRTAFMRFGVVLGTEGGALPLMVLPYKLFAGGTVGTGKQWVSWIHVDDVICAIDFAIQNNIHGPVNVTAPSPVRMKEFGQTVAKVMNRPHWMPAPSFLMKAVLGKKSALVLEGQHVVPEMLLHNGFTFAFSTLEEALADLLR